MSVITDTLPFRGRPRGRPVFIAVLAAAAAGAVGGAVYTVTDSGAAVATTAARTVTVKSGVVQTTVSGSGNLEAVHQRDLTFTRTGTVTKVYVKAGQKVAEGQVLARLDPSDTTLAVRWLRAPYAGTIASVDVAVGDVVTGTKSSDATSATQTEATAAFGIVQLTSYDLAVSVSEADIGDVKVGQTATVTVSASGEQLAARVLEVGVVTASSSETSDTAGAATSSSSGAVSYPVTLRLTQTSDTIKPGMTATADIVTAESEGLTVPTQALRGSMVTLAGRYDPARAGRRRRGIGDGDHRRSEGRRQGTGHVHERGGRGERDLVRQRAAVPSRARWVRRRRVRWHGRTASRWAAERRRHAMTPVIEVGGCRARLPRHGRARSARARRRVADDRAR